MSERKTYMGRPNFPSDDRAAGDLGRERRLNVKTFSAVVLGDMPAAAGTRAVAVEPTGRVARRPAEISVGLHDGREWEAASGGMQASAKRYAEKFGSDFIL